MVQQADKFAGLSRTGEAREKIKCSFNSARSNSGDTCLQRFDGTVCGLPGLAQFLLVPYSGFCTLSAAERSANFC